MFDMFKAVACTSPKRRSRGALFSLVDTGVIRIWRRPSYLNPAVCKEVFIADDRLTNKFRLTFPFPKRTLRARKGLGLQLSRLLAGGN